MLEQRREMPKVIVTQANREIADELRTIYDPNLEPVHDKVHLDAERREKAVEALAEKIRAGAVSPQTGLKHLLEISEFFGDWRSSPIRVNSTSISYTAQKEIPSITALSENEDSRAKMLALASLQDGPHLPGIIRQAHDLMHTCFGASPKRAALCAEALANAITHGPKHVDWDAHGRIIEDTNTWAQT